MENLSYIYFFLILVFLNLVLQYFNKVFIFSIMYPLVFQFFLGMCVYILTHF